MKTCPLHIKKEREVSLFIHCGCYHNRPLFCLYHFSETLSWQKILHLVEWHCWVLPLELLLILLGDLSRKQEYQGCWQTCAAEFPAAQTHLWQLYFFSPHWMIPLSPEEVTDLTIFVLPPFVYCVPKACELWSPDRWKSSPVYFCTSTIIIIIWWLERRKKLLVSTFVRLSMFVGSPCHLSFLCPVTSGLCLAVQFFPIPKHTALGVN